jgi:hypothetical protein
MRACFVLAWRESYQGAVEVILAVLRAILVEQVSLIAMSNRVETRIASEDILS